MIDAIKTQVRDTVLTEYLRQHPKLEWVSNEDRFNRFDCEVIKTKHVRQFKGIVFRFFDDRLDIIFRPHFYFNGNVHNANDFSMVDSIQTMLEFQDVFQVDLQELPVFMIEYGLNGVSPVDVKDLITYTYAHDRNEFRNDPDLAFSKRSFSVDKRGKANTYKSVKFYAKGIQQVGHCHPDTFRFEIKSQMRKYIRQLGINTMYDLIRPEVYAKLAESIIAEFDALLILDGSADLSRLSVADQHRMLKYQNTATWYRIMQQYRNAFSRNKRSYYELLDKTGVHLKQQLSSMFSQSFMNSPKQKVNRWCEFHRNKQETAPLYCGCSKKVKKIVNRTERLTPYPEKHLFSVYPAFIICWVGSRLLSHTPF